MPDPVDGGAESAERRARLHADVHARLGARRHRVVQHERRGGGGAEEAEGGDEERGAAEPIGGRRRRLERENKAICKQR